MKYAENRFNKYLVNFSRIKKIKEKYLITTDQGSWLALDKGQYKKLITYQLDQELFNSLENLGIIVTENNTQIIIERQRKRVNHLFYPTNLHIIVPTPRCNQKCIYCHSAAKGASISNIDMKEETADKILEFILKSPAKEITIEFQGGEPLLNKEMFKHIIIKAKELNKQYSKKIEFVLVTNLTLIDEDTMDFIVKNQVKFCTSLDGPKKIHDANRRYENLNPSYDDVKRKMKFIEKKYDVDVPCMMVTTRNSLNNWKEIIDEYVNLGMRVIQIKDMSFLGFAKNTTQKIGYSTEEFCEFWKKSIEYLIELNKKGVKIKERYASLILHKIISVYDPGFTDFRTPCGAVTGQMVYDYNGDIYCCDEAKGEGLFKLGNVKEDSFEKILLSEKSQNIISSSINESALCDACVYKPYCGLCPVKSYSETGNLLTNLAKSRKCKIAKYQFDYLFDKIVFDENAKEILLKWM